jgi:DNA repair protein SbcC/Rad50
LLVDEEEVNAQGSAASNLKDKIAEVEKSLTQAEAKVSERAELETKRNEGRERQAALKVENETLRLEMNQLKERIDTLKVCRGRTCPLCGQELSEKHRKSTLNNWKRKASRKATKYRSNQKEAVELAHKSPNTNYRSQLPPPKTTVSETCE